MQTQNATLCQLSGPRSVQPGGCTWICPLSPSGQQMHHFLPARSLLAIVWGIAANWKYMELFIVSHPQIPACCPLWLCPGPREGADRGGWGSGFQAKLNPAASWAQQRLCDLRKISVSPLTRLTQTNRGRQSFPSHQVFAAALPLSSSCLPVSRSAIQGSQWLTATQTKLCLN